MTAWARVPLVVGHRGGRGEGWPRENTLAAFERARREGARAIELDVRTAGEEVIVLHDAPADARARQPLEVPRLGEVLAWAGATGTAVNVEMKHDVPDRLALARATTRAVKASHADVLLSSFDPALLVMAAALAPRVPRAVLVHARQGAPGELLQRSPRALGATIHLERTQTEPARIRRLRRRGLRVGVWTVNDAREARDLVALGVATIITDRPGEILRALGDGAGPEPLG